MRTICGRSVFKSYITPKRKGKQNARGREGQGRNRTGDGQGYRIPLHRSRAGTKVIKSPPLPPSCLNSSLGAISTTHLKKGPIAPGQEGVREFYLVVDAPPLNVFHEGKLDYFYFTSNTGGGLLRTCLFLFFRTLQLQD